MTRIYATVGDLPASMQGSEFAEPLIGLASALVTTAIQNARFPTGEDGMPSEEADLQACQSAVVIQVSTWLSTGVHPFSGGFAAKQKQVASKSTNGSSVSYAFDAAADAYLNDLAGGTVLTDAALAPLGAQGLLTTWLRPGPGLPRPFTGAPMFVGGTP